MTNDPNIKQAVPFFLVSDIEESVKYYVDGLGFKITHKWTDDGNLRWCWLQNGGAALMLQEMSKDSDNTSLADSTLGAGVSIYFICNDALLIYRETSARGIDATQAPFVGNGMWVTSYLDPDGYRVFFESETDAPEETVYFEGEQ